MNFSAKIKKAFGDIGFQIFLAMIIGIVVGRVMGEPAAVFAPLGTLFIQLIKMLVVPLVFISIVIVTGKQIGRAHV